MDGVEGLGPELIGCYAYVLDLIYSRNGYSRRDDKALGGRLGCSSRKATALTDRLIELGKIEVTADGFLTHWRAVEHAEEADDLSKTRSKSGRAGGVQSGKTRRNQREMIVKQSRTEDEPSVNRSRTDVENNAGSSKNNALAEASASSKTNQIREDKSIERDKSLSRDREDRCLAAWNDYASRHGWPQVKTFSDKRRKALRARLSEVGEEGFRAALDRAARSTFILRSTFFTFDFLIGPSNFAKVADGNYDDRTEASKTPGAKAGGDDGFERNLMQRYGLT
jgi:hypothetical protein